jgi:hypothetical protein
MGAISMADELNSIRSRIEEIKILLQTDTKSKDNEYKKQLAEELDRLSYKCYRAVIEQLRDIEGNGDGI